MRAATIHSSYEPKAQGTSERKNIINLRLLCSEELNENDVDAERKNGANTIFICRVLFHRRFSAYEKLTAEFRNIVLSVSNMNILTFQQKHWNFSGFLLSPTVSHANHFRIWILRATLRIVI